MWKVIIDTNWWVSFAISNFKNDLLKVLFHPKIEVISSVSLRNEVFEAFEYPKLSKLLSEERKARGRFLFENFTRNMVAHSIVNICRDEKDNFLLALAQDSEADFLLTGDKDLLVLNPFGKTQILRLPEFLDWLDSQI